MTPLVFLLDARCVLLPIPPAVLGTESAVASGPELFFLIGFGLLIIGLIGTRNRKSRRLNTPAGLPARSSALPPPPERQG